MTELEFVLREITQLRSDLSVALAELRTDRDAIEKEVSELRMVFARHPAPSRRRLARDSGLTISGATVGIILSAVIQYATTGRGPLPLPHPAPTGQAP